MPLYNVTVENGQAIIATDGSTVTATNQVGTDGGELAKLIAAVQSATGSLPPEDKEAVMESLEVIEAEASAEKHIPVYDVEGSTVHVTVGSVEHPMTKEHYIEWICLETEHVIQYAHLDPDDKPKAKFALCEGDEVRSVYAFCNQHNLWRN